MLSEITVISPKISIGIVVYNGIGHIKDTLDSIVKQSYKNIELVVVDGNSTDGTRDVLAEYSEHISVLVSESDNGIYDAMNKVCKLATGDWLLFMGCDDLLFDVLEKTTQKMLDPNSLYYGDVIFRSSGEIYGGEFSKHRLARKNICHQALFYPRSVYKTYSYNLKYKIWADYDYNIRVIGNGAPFHYLDSIISMFNEDGRSKPGDSDFEKIKLTLIHESFGMTYMISGFLYKISLDIIRFMGKVLKKILPDSYWKYLHAVCRRKLMKY